MTTHAALSLKDSLAGHNEINVTLKIDVLGRVANAPPIDTDWMAPHVRDGGDRFVSDDFVILPTGYVTPCLLIQLQHRTANGVMTKFVSRSKFY